MFSKALLEFIFLVSLMEVVWYWLLFFFFLVETSFELSLGRMLPELVFFVRIRFWILVTGFTSRALGLSFGLYWPLGEMRTSVLEIEVLRF